MNSPYCFLRALIATNRRKQARNLALSWLENSSQRSATYTAARKYFEHEQAAEGRRRARRAAYHGTNQVYA